MPKKEEPFFIVVRQGDVFGRHLGGIPTPALIDACNDGHAHEAWRTPEGIWRLRDDDYDSNFIGVKYVNVRVGRNPGYRGYPG